MEELKLRSKIECPKCRNKIEEIMPENSCVHFYKCPVCGELLKAKPDTCCVFCSYGDVECPPKQKEKLNNIRGKQNERDKSNNKTVKITGCN